MYSTSITAYVGAPRESVYRALTDPHAIARWRVPDGMSARVDEAGGDRFRISLTYDAADATGKTSSRTDTYRARFVTLVPGERVVEESEFETGDPALRGVMTMTTTLTDSGDGTEVTIHHEGIPDAIRPADNETGTRMALAGLARFLAGA